MTKVRLRYTVLWIRALFESSHTKVPKTFRGCLGMSTWRKKGLRRNQKKESSLRKLKEDTVMEQFRRQRKPQKGKQRAKGQNWLTHQRRRELLRGLTKGGV